MNQVAKGKYKFYKQARKKAFAKPDWHEITMGNCKSFGLGTTQAPQEMGRAVSRARAKEADRRQMLQHIECQS